jgi:glycosyltransferase involved in cell wall biosynthesis
VEGTVNTNAGQGGLMTGGEPFHVLLVGNYAPDRQFSMLRFATLLYEGLAARGVPVTLIQPPVVVGRRFARPRRPGKWIGYLDKFLLFPPRLRRAARRSPAGQTVVHICDHSNAMYAPWVRHLPHLVTCHDLQAVRSARSEFAETNTRWSGRILQAWIVRGLRQSDTVVCDSGATRADLLRIAETPAERVGVIHPGVSQAFRPTALTAASAHVRDLADRGGFILHVGGNNWYKNRVGLLKIYAALVDRLPGAPPLVVAGKPLPPDIRALASTPGLSGRVIEFADLTDSDLAALYSSAALLLFPSLAEGLGWPVLEAMACGCRVVTSNRAPLTEVGGAAATYIDPQRHSEAAAVVANVLAESHADRQAHVAAGYAQAAQFRLDKMIDGYLRTYRAVLDGASHIPSSLEAVK